MTTNKSSCLGADLRLRGQEFGRQREGLQSSDLWILEISKGCCWKYFFRMFFFIFFPFFAFGIFRFQPWYVHFTAGERSAGSHLSCTLVWTPQQTISTPRNSCSNSADRLRSIWKHMLHVEHVLLDPDFVSGVYFRCHKWFLLIPNVYVYVYK